MSLGLDEFLGGLALDHQLTKFHRNGKYQLMDILDVKANELAKLGLSDLETKKILYGLDAWKDGQDKRSSVISVDFDGAYDNLENLTPSPQKQPHTEKKAEPAEARGSSYEDFVPTGGPPKPSSSPYEHTEINLSQTRKGTVRLKPGAGKATLDSEAEQSTWFVGPTSHDAIAAVLINDPIGTFVIRTSSKSPEKPFVIAFRKPTKTVSLHILLSNQGIYLEKNPDMAFKTLTEFVEFYSDKLNYGDLFDVDLTPRSQPLSKALSDAPKVTSKESTADHWYTENGDLDVKELVRNGSTGEFLIRKSRQPGKFVITVKEHGTTVTNYLISLNNGTYTLAGKSFPSMAQCIYHFRAAPLQPKVGKPYTLGNAVPGGQPFTEPGSVSTAQPAKSPSKEQAAPKSFPAPNAKKEKKSFNQVLAMYDFQHEDPQYLPLKKGRLYDLLDNSDAWWTLQDEDGKTGLAPSNYLKLHTITLDMGGADDSSANTSPKSSKTLTLDGFSEETETDDWGHWQLSRNQIEMKNKLGEGEYGEVWRGILKGTGENEGMVANVAIKTLKKAESSNEFMKEAEAMIILHHENLVSMYGVCTTSDPYLIVTELCENGSLDKHLLKRKRNKAWLRLSDINKMVLDTVSGMAYLEENFCVHRDLACRNILLNEQSICKVADFGFARIVEEGIYTAKEGTKCPIRWSAPESLDYNTFTSKSDVFSFAIVIWEIVTYGKLPYEKMSNQEVVDFVSGKKRLPQPKGCSNALYKIMEASWQHKPEDRPTFKELLEEAKAL
eukprot:m.339237 g.339237  ORF g.339237 m.339237 type:complete len:778 (+) comp18716_c0_seq1:219-2552(+)